MKETYLYICDKKPGACTGWEKDKDGNAWQKCENEFCFHTSKVEHAKYKNESSRTFAIVCHDVEKPLFFEVVRACDHPAVKCKYKTEVGPDSLKVCIEKECPHWRLRE